jgi:uncharacterized phage-associated protein
VAWPRLQQLLLYVARASESDPRFEAVKLNKILYFADFAAYRRLGHSITEAEYQNRAEGPVPRELLPARRALQDAGAAAIELRRFYDGRTQQRLVAIQDPDPDTFTDDEREIVDEVIKELWLLDGRAVSDLSRREFGWVTTIRSETIPYHTAWVGSGTLTAEQIAVGMEVAERHGSSGSLGESFTLREAPGFLSRAVLLIGSPERWDEIALNFSLLLCRVPAHGELVVSGLRAISLLTSPPLTVYYRVVDQEGVVELLEIQVI